MESNPTAAAPSEPGKHRKRKVLGVLLGLLAILTAVLAVRGTWADTEPRNPASAADGARSQLLLSGGRKWVRCAMVVEQAPEALWQVITDYKRFDQTFSTIGALQVEWEGDSRCHLAYTVDTPIGKWPIDVQIRNEASPERYVSEWDGPNENFDVMSGSWTLTPAGQGKTLLVYLVDAELKHYPNFLVRNLLLSRLKRVLREVAQAAASRASPAK